LGQQNGSIRPHVEHCPFEADAIAVIRGEIRLARWLRRLLRRPPDHGDSPERARERMRQERQPEEANTSAAENIHRAGSGTFFT